MNNPVNHESRLTPIASPLDFDVVLSFGNAGPETNVPVSVIHHSPSGFDWGYPGSGPADLSLNILNSYIPAGSDGEDPVPRYRGSCSQIAWDLHQQFKDTHLAGLPREGGTLTREIIKNFIGEALRRRHELDAGLALQESSLRRFYEEAIDDAL